MSPTIDTDNNLKLQFSTVLAKFPVILRCVFNFFSESVSTET